MNKEDQLLFRGKQQNSPKKKMKPFTFKE